MQRVSLLLTSAATVVLVPGSATAAPQVTRGMTFSWPNGVSVDTDHGQATNPDRTLLKAPSNQTTSPYSWSYPGQSSQPAAVPDYSYDAMFGTALADIMEIDAHSTGWDWIPDIDLDGAPAVGGTNNNWLAWIVSVDDASIGPVGSYLHTVSQTRATGAELVGFYSRGSINIASELVGATTVEASALSLGYTNANVENIDAIDLPLGIRTFDPTGTSSNFLFVGNDRYFYFSVTPAFVTAFESQHGAGANFAVDDAGKDVPARPGDIYRIEWEWQGPSTPAWTPDITVYREGVKDMGLLPGEDIDALAVNSYNGALVFSTTPGSSGGTRDVDQLQAHMPAWSAPTQLMDRDPNVTGPGALRAVQDELDLGREDINIDAVCGIDPEGTPSQYDRLAGATTHSTADSALVVPYPELRNLMDISFCRGFDGPAGAESLHVQLSGWGGHVPQDAVVQLWIRWDLAGSPFFTPIPQGADPIAFGGWDLLETRSRDGGEEFVEFVYPVPAVTTPVALMAFMWSTNSDGQAQVLLAGSMITQFGL